MLTGKQRAELRKLANSMETIIQIGKGGINENLIKTINEALEKREMIKLRVLENSEFTVQSAAEETSKSVNAQVIQIVGTRFILYKQNKNPKKRIYNV